MSMMFTNELSSPADRLAVSPSTMSITGSSFPAKAGRSCSFMNDEATFIAANGDVMPCHFLWHNYTCRVLQEAVAVRKRTFGNIARQCLLQIWQSENYRQFRDEASRSQYAPCWTCSQGPCPTLVNDEDQYANDCFGSRVPCGHCQWNLGGVRCM